MTNLDDLKRNGRTVLISCLDVSLEVYVQELENKVQFLIRVYDVQEPGKWETKASIEYKCEKDRNEGSPNDIVIL